MSGTDLALVMLGYTALCVVAGYLGAAAARRIFKHSTATAQASDPQPLPDGHPTSDAARAHPSARAASSSTQLRAGRDDGPHEGLCSLCWTGGKSRGFLATVGMCCVHGMADQRDHWIARHDEQAARANALELELEAVSRAFVSTVDADRIERIAELHLNRAARTYGPGTVRCLIELRNDLMTAAGGKT
jgi:hypothetical protein